jgi:hypothetical protein
MSVIMWKLNIHLHVHIQSVPTITKPFLLWTYGTWIYNYLCNQCPSPLKLWVLIPLMAKCTFCDEVCQWLAAGLLFSSDTSVSTTNKTECHDITAILLKVVLVIITLTLFFLWLMTLIPACSDVYSIHFDLTEFFSNLWFMIFFSYFSFPQQ